MNRSFAVKRWLFAAALASGAVGAYAATSAPQPGSSMHGQSDGMMGKGMMGGDMMDMMRSCHSMMGSGGMGMTGMPNLPPGNEKLEAQMHAEMMQKMGEIAARYAEKIKEAR